MKFSGEFHFDEVAIAKAFRETGKPHLIAIADELDPPHTWNGKAGFGTHRWDCPPCVAADAERRAGRKNPHRPGTKVAARWESLNEAGLTACDPRTETYWSM